LLLRFDSKFLNFNVYHLTRYYYANVDKTRRKINQLIKDDEWNSDEA